MSAPPLWHRYDGPMNDASAATINLLRALNVAAAPGTIAGYVSAHPAYPSLASIVDCLAELGVRASARRISPDALASVPVPVLVHLRDGGATGAFWLMTDHDSGRFTCRSPSGQVVSLSQADLAARYLGVAVSATAEDGAGERYASRNALGDRLRAKRPAAALASLLLAIVTSCAAATRSPSEWLAPALGLLISGFLGFALTSYLGMRDHLGGSGLLAALCPTGRRFNCASVVGSDGGYVAGVVPLADLGSAFFAAELVAGVTAALAHVFETFAVLLAAFGVVLVPVIVYSLVQQAFVVRRWCTLCLLVDGVLAAQLAIAARASRFDFGALRRLESRDVFLLAASALAAALACAVVRSLVAPALAAPRLRADLEALRGSSEAFAATLARSPAVTTDVAGKLFEGDAAASLEILVVSHPFCVACADAHAAVRRLVVAFPRLVRGATVFAVPESDGAAMGAASSLLAGERELGDWYDRVNENVREWMATDRSHAASPEQASILAAQRAFAEGAGVAGTPAIFVDGRRLPPGFGLRHLRFYLRAEQRRLRTATFLPERARDT